MKECDNKMLLILLSYNSALVLKDFPLDKPPQKAPSFRNMAI